MTAVEDGPKRRIRPSSFADHYSQARQFFQSQQAVEQTHIVDSFVFELSKVQRPDIRERMVANLANVDQNLAAAVADGLGLRTVPDPSPQASPRVDGLEPSPHPSPTTPSSCSHPGTTQPG